MTKEEKLAFEYGKTFDVSKVPEGYFHFHQEAFQFLFTFCHKGCVICISEVIDISAGNLDSSLCFIQPRISHDEPAYKLNKQGDNIQP